MIRIRKLPRWCRLLAGLIALVLLGAGATACAEQPPTWTYKVEMVPLPSKAAVPAGTTPRVVISLSFQGQSKVDGAVVTQLPYVSEQDSWMRPTARFQATVVDKAAIYAVKCIISYAHHQERRVVQTSNLGSDVLCEQFRNT